MKRKCGILPLQLTIACLGKIPHFLYLRFLTLFRNIIFF